MSNKPKYTAAEVAEILEKREREKRSTQLSESAQRQLDRGRERRHEMAMLVVEKTLGTRDERDALFRSGYGASRETARSYASKVAKIVDALMSEEL